MPGSDLRKEEIFEMIQPALERLSRQVERTFEHYATMMPGERIVRIFVSGAMNVYQPIVDYVGSQLGISSAVLDPLSEQESAACPDVDDTDCISERIAFGPALGLALSDNDHTPNLMFTYKDKERADQHQADQPGGLRRSSWPSCSSAPSSSSTRTIVISQKKAEIAGLETQIARLGPPVDRNQLLQMAAKVNQRSAALQGLRRPVSGHGPDQRTRRPDADEHPFYRSEDQPRTGAGAATLPNKPRKRREGAGRRRSRWRG